MISAKIITIGDEILIGQIVDTNSTFISKQLINIGIEVSEILSISDEKESILNALNNSLNKFDIVITTGGLGPTNDDITKEVFCEFFNDKLVHNQDLLLHIENLFKKFANNPINDLNRAQSLVPSQSKLIENKFGTGPIRFSKNGLYYHGLYSKKDKKYKWFEKGDCGDGYFWKYGNQKTKLPNANWDTYDEVSFCKSCSEVKTNKRINKVVLVWAVDI